MNNTYIKWFMLSVLLLIAQAGLANRYIYIQGDKKVPFVVAVEGYSLPKLGTHYCIIPNLEPGIAHISITFQSSDYPVHKFKVRVPEHSSRGLILTKVSDRSYALFDMQTMAYISDNNTEDDAFLAFNPEEFPSTVKKRSRTPADRPVASVPSSGASESTRRQTIPLSERGKEFSMPTLVRPDNKQEQKEKSRKTEFLEGIDLSQSKKYKDNGLSGAPEQTPEPRSSSSASCTTASSNEEFEDFSALYVNQKDDTEKLKYIRKNKSTICLNTSQIHILSTFLAGQSSKFELLDMLKAQVTDRENYPKLQSVFNNSFMKEKFLETLK